MSRRGTHYRSDGQARHDRIAERVKRRVAEEARDRVSRETADDDQTPEENTSP